MASVSEARSPNVLQQGFNGLVNLPVQIGHMGVQGVTDVANFGMSTIRNIRTFTQTVKDDMMIDGRGLPDPAFQRALAGEFLASFLFLFLSLTTVISSGVVITADISARIWNISITFGLMIVVLVYCFADISGANVNPAVSFGLALTKKISWYRFVCYVIVQCLGAVIGAAFAKWMNPGRFDRADGGCNMVNIGNGYNLHGAVGAEICATFLLVFTVMCAIDSHQGSSVVHVQNLGPLAIGLSVTMAHLALIPIDGCSINPARSIASVLISGGGGNCWENLWVFLFCPMIGGALGAMTYDFTFHGRHRNKKH